MKISYTTAHTTYVTLADESDRTATCEVLSPSFTAQVQAEPLFRAATPALFTRGNAQCALAVVVTMPYATRALALASIRTLRGILAASLHLKVEEGTEVQYYPNAVCSGYAPTLRGVTVEHHISWITQDVTSSAPSTDPT